MDRRIFPLSVEFFRQEVEPLIAGHHKRSGRPPDKKIKMDLVWIDSTTVSLAPSRVWGIKKQNPPLGGKERAEALKIHVGLCQGFL